MLTMIQELIQKLKQQQVTTGEILKIVERINKAHQELSEKIVRKQRRIYEK